jgi:hypothetical protein
MGLTFEIIPVGAERAGDVHSVTLSIWRGKVSPTSTVFNETPETISAQISRGGAILAMAEGEVIGSGRFVMVPGPAGDKRPWMEVKRIGLMEAFRGQHGGEALCLALEAMGRAKGAVGAQLAVRFDQPRLVRVYAALGYMLADDVALTTNNPLAPPPVGMRKLFSPFNTT